MSLYFGDTTVGLDVSTGLFVVSLIFSVNKSLGQITTATPFVHMPYELLR